MVFIAIDAPLNTVLNTVKTPTTTDICLANLVTFETTPNKKSFKSLTKFFAVPKFSKPKSINSPLSKFLPFCNSENKVSYLLSASSLRALFSI